MRNRRCLLAMAALWTFCCPFLVLAAGEPKPRPDAVSGQPTAETYRRLTEQIDSHFRNDVLPRWFPRSVDRDHGGFCPDFRGDWSPGPTNDKTIVFQSRMTWVAAQVAMRYPELRKEYLDYARHGAKFLAEVMWDRRDGGFFWRLDASGKLTPRYGDEKHMYGISFALYALAAAAHATGDPAILDLAKRTFAWMETHAHDAKNGGYFEALSRDGRPILASRTESAGGDPRFDLLHTHYGFKSMNSHIHLLESVTALYQAWPDPSVKVRLCELLAVVRDKVAVEPGCLNLYFTPDWRAVPDHDSFGHDVETAFLLLEAAEALHEPDDPKTLAVARSLVDHALEWGWDGKLGGFYDRGAAFGPATHKEKIWWTQAEGLNALLMMHARFGKQTPTYWNAFLKQWEFIWKYQIDSAHGEWHNTVEADGTVRPGQPKASIWKAAYHNGRALMQCEALLRRLAQK